MGKRYLRLIRRPYKYYILLFLVYELDASNSIDIEKLIPNIEIVSTFEDRKKGLMFKQSIPDDFGMFFIWEYENEQCMWMKDTFIPLSLAYISNDGEIIDIHDMVPFSRKSVCSSKPVKYALEVNKNWFKENNISIGDTLEIKRIILNDN
tara:strand:- start:1058 stop:1507 length:450 start_codon:yes stop_codon:yes gene_type:complete